MPLPLWPRCCRSPHRRLSVAASPLPSPPLPVPRGLVIITDKLFIIILITIYRPQSRSARTAEYSVGAARPPPPREATHSRYILPPSAPHRHAAQTTHTYSVPQASSHRSTLTPSHPTPTDTLESRTHTLQSYTHTLSLPFPGLLGRPCLGETSM